MGQSAIVSIFRYDYHFWRSQWVLVMPHILLYFISAKRWDTIALCHTFFTYRDIVWKFSVFDFTFRRFTLLKSFISRQSEAMLRSFMLRVSWPCFDCLTLTLLLQYCSLCFYIFYPVPIQRRKRNWWMSCSPTSLRFLMIIASLHFYRNVRSHPPG
jgi:hypothetical protein